MAVVSRILSTGTLLVNGSFDEVSYNTTGATGAYVYKNGVSTATNKYTYSQDFSLAYWGKGSSSTITQNTVIAPDGSLTGATWTGSTGTPFFTGQESIVNGTAYTFSIYMKAGTQINAGILLYGTQFNSGGANGFPVWNLSTGALVTAPPAFITAYGIQAVGNGWYRAYVTATATTTLNTNQQIARMQDASYVTGNYMYMWGAQVEVAASSTSPPTPYVATGATTSINLNNFAQRTISSGIKYVSGSFDEVSYNQSLTGAYVYNNGVSTSVNKLNYSQDFTNWSKNAAPNDYTVNADSTDAPDGSTTADLIIKSTGVGSSSICYKIFTGAISTAYCGSIYVKAGGYSKVKVKFGGTGFNSIDTGGTFDLAGDGTVNSIINGSTCTITSVGNSWYRITVTATSDADGGSYNFSITPLNAAYNEAFAGDGTSGIYAWGGQVETGSTATAYVATGATTSINLNDFARRDINTGIEYVSGAFDEVTWNPPIVTSGLVLNVDASVPASYNGTGTTLTDLSSSTLNGTLSNSALPYVASGTTGYFNFNSTYNIAFPVSTTLNFEGVLPFSFNIWTNPRVDPGPNNYYSFYSRDANPGTGRSGYTLWITQDLVTPANIRIGTERYASGTQSGGAAVSIASSGFIGTWNMFTVTYDGSNLRLYINGVLRVTGTGATAAIVNNVTPLSINTANQNRQYMGQLLAYNTTLSLTDIKQNYNATCYRYGLSPI